jgi:uncharacterized membrane protein
VLVRWLLGHAHAGADRGDEDPLAILRRRYAAGEIDQATYERMKREQMPWRFLVRKNRSWHRRYV